MENILESTGRRVILLGNEAIVRGALEAGVDFVSTFPGTPASEIGDSFAKISKCEAFENSPRGGKTASEVSVRNRRCLKLGGRGEFYFEYSTNEKVALEAAAGAAFSSLKSLVAMKHFGLNVASDALLPIVYTGVEGAMVVVIADDPGCWSSAQTEQDTRYYAEMAHIPMFEPSDPQECKDFIKLAFEISKKFKIPVMVRTTTRVAHQSVPVNLGKITNHKSQIVRIAKGRFSTMPPNVLRMKKELLEKIEKIRDFSDKTKINKIENWKLKIKNFGIITSGVSYLYVMESLKELNLNLPVLKLGFTYPFPKKMVGDFIEKIDKVLVVEEIESYLEEKVRALAKDANPKLKIFGSELPKIGELRPEYVLQSIAEISGKKINLNLKIHQKNFQKLELLKRFPNLCPGCPYWLIFSALKRTLQHGSGQVAKNVVFGGDIGCYMLAGCPPHNIQDWLISMGSSIGISHGVRKSGSQKVISIIGDSTFFHAGIPALINTVFNKSNPLIIILDNGTTGMTGHQPHPGVGKTGSGEETPALKLEDMVLACGVKNLKTIDPVNQEEFISTIKDFLEKKEVSVIVAKHPCIFLKKS